jgi:hypothetical protein
MNTISSQTITMSANNNNIFEDKQLVHSLFSSEALKQIAEKNNEVPVGYFENYESTLLAHIKSTQKKPKRFVYSKWGKMAIAACFFSVIAGAYLFIENRINKNLINANVSLQEITTSEINAYVNDNEELAEIDWQSEITKEASSLDLINPHLMKDTNSAQ